MYNTPLALSNWVARTETATKQMSLFWSAYNSTSAGILGFWETNDIVASWLLCWCLRAFYTELDGSELVALLSWFCERRSFSNIGNWRVFGRGIQWQTTKTIRFIYSAFAGRQFYVNALSSVKSCQKFEKLKDRVSFSSIHMFDVRWSVFTHMVSSHANLLEQRKVFT